MNKAIRQLGLFLCIILCSTHSARADPTCSGRLTSSAARVVRGYFQRPFGACAFTFGYYGPRRTLELTLSPGSTLVAQLLVVLPSGLQEGPSPHLVIALSQHGTYRVRVISREQTIGGFTLQEFLK